jgi:uncharacterized protein (DUF362 family)
MKLHPLLNDPLAVLVSRTPVSDPVSWEDFRLAAHQVAQALQLELEGEKVVMKPNVTSGEQFANPDSGIGTHPAFVGGLAEYVRDHGARRGGIYVLEDPRNSNDNEPRHWKGTGYIEIAERTGAKLRCPNDSSVVKKAVPNPMVHAERRVSRLAVAPNTVFVNVPKLKTHNLGITTLCMKNLMGVDRVFDRHYCGQAMQDIPDDCRVDGKPKEEWMDQAIHEMWQEGLARRLADIGKVATPHLNIIEGIVGRDGTGFQRGRNFSLGLAIAGINMVSVDSVASYLVGFDPQKLVYLRVAKEAGLGTNDLSQLRVYTVQDGQVVPCENIETLRIDPPFRVISGIKGEVIED